MKIFGTDNFISERVKVKAITNAEWDKVKEDMEETLKNPFRLTKDDLIGNIEGYPMGIIVKMLEEQKAQTDKANIRVFQKNKCSNRYGDGFDWGRTIISKDKYKADPWTFWNEVIDHKNFDLFFDVFPDYKKYNLD